MRAQSVDATELPSELVGTSGWYYDHWLTPFYPTDLSRDEFLPYYADRLHTVEVNDTFYQWPDPETLSHWRVLGLFVQGGNMALELTSAAFGANETIPDRYTCGGTNISPPLAWYGTPAEAKSLVLLCDDPDSSRQPWSHWVLYDIPPTMDELEEGIPPDGRLPSGALQGRNDFGDIGYGGPCPSTGTHHYYFRLYALDSELEIPPGANRAQVLDLIGEHILARSDLMGKYRRS